MSKENLIFAKYKAVDQLHTIAQLTSTVLQMYYTIKGQLIAIQMTYHISLL